MTKLEYALSKSTGNEKTIHELELVPISNESFYEMVSSYEVEEMYADSLRNFRGDKKFFMGD